MAFATYLPTYMYVGLAWKMQFLHNLGFVDANGTNGEEFYLWVRDFSSWFFFII